MANAERRTHDETPRGQTEDRQPQKLWTHQRGLECERDHAQPPDSGNGASAQVDATFCAGGWPERRLHEASVSEAQGTRARTRFPSNENRSQDLTPQPQARPSGPELLDDVTDKRFVVHAQDAQDMQGASRGGRKPVMVLLLRVPECRSTTRRGRAA